jgi:hypothetical protein
MRPYCLMEYDFGRLDGVYATVLPSGEGFWSLRRGLCDRIAFWRRILVA